MSQPNDHGQPQQWPPVPYGQPGLPPAYGQPPQPAWGVPGAAPGSGPAAHQPPGAPVAPPGGFPGARPYKEPTVAWVLWVFLGFVGAHHFYLGNTGRGVLYLVGFLLSLVTSVIVIGFFGYLALFVLWIVDATQMSRRVQEVNARIFAANRAAGLA